MGRAGEMAEAKNAEWGGRTAARHCEVRDGQASGEIFPF